jgi:DNA polymerase IV
MENSADPKMRKIIHIDMDAFYASVEQRDNEEYRNKPIAVGGSPEGRGGVVAAASYEARKYGVRSAMPSKRAKQLCPELIFVRPRFSVYQEVSVKIREIFRRYTDHIEPLSLDEAYLDVTEDKLNIGSAIEVATRIRKEIFDELHLTASAGVSINKFVAKIASDINKPNGLTFIGPSKIESFMENLPVEKFYGVGKVTAQKMKNMGLHTGADLKRLSDEEMKRRFGKMGQFFYNIVRGIDDREVRSQRETKSIGAEDTFPYDLETESEMFPELDKLAATVHTRLTKYNMKARTVTIKIKYNTFKSVTRSHSFPEPINDREIIYKTSCELLIASGLDEVKIRLLGISLSNFGTPLMKDVPADTDQLKLF